VLNQHGRQIVMTQMTVMTQGRRPRATAHGRLWVLDHHEMGTNDAESRSIEAGAEPYSRFHALDHYDRYFVMTQMTMMTQD
jgi:hypothetical protein